jgi:hypothetical protein
MSLFALPFAARQEIMPPSHKISYAYFNADITITFDIDDLTGVVTNYESSGLRCSLMDEWVTLLSNPHPGDPHYAHFISIDEFLNVLFS